jgi:hypothetical protein
MSTPRAQRSAATFVAVLLALVTEAAAAGRAPAAYARYTASQIGTRSAKAATLPVPPAPTITSVGIRGATCVVQLSWTVGGCRRIARCRGRC